MRWILLAIAVTLAGCLQTPSDEPVDTQSIRIPGQWVFEPQVARVEVGVPVMWTNNGAADHTVTIKALGIDETIAPGKSFSYIFEDEGTFAYECVLHPPGMVGKIIAVASNNSSA